MNKTYRYKEDRINTGDKRSRMNASNKEDRISVGDEKNRMNPCYQKNKMSVEHQKNKMRTQYGKNKMMGWDVKNIMSVSYQKNKMSVVEGDNIINFEKPNQNQNHPHHLKPKSKTEIGFHNGISLGILSATRDSAILSVLFNIILIISK